MYPACDRIRRDEQEAPLQRAVCFSSIADSGSGNLVSEIPRNGARGTGGLDKQLSVLIKIVSNVGTISRFYTLCGSLLEAFSAVGHCIAQLERIPVYARAGVLKKVLVLPVTTRSVVPVPRGVQFTNMCGRVLHAMHTRSVANIYMPGVQPMIQFENGAFGDVAQIFTDAGNFCTCHNGQYTLVRGARCSKAVCDMLGMVMQKEAISDVSVHMLVASARLGHLVDTSSDMFMECLQGFFSHVELGESTLEGSERVKTVQLRQAHPHIASAFECKGVRQVLLSIGQKGSLNFFFSFHPNTPLVVGFEETLRALCTQIAKGIDAST